MLSRLNSFIVLLLSLLFPKKKEPSIKSGPLKMDLQFFAEGGDDDDDDEGNDDDDDEEDGPDLDELLKDPKFKKKYQEKVKAQLDKRFKKFKDVDPEEYRRLKEQAAKQSKKKADDEEDELETLKSENKAKEEKLLRAERREKRVAVKEFAIENGYNHKLLSRLIDIDKVDLDENGEPDNLEELFDEIQEEFPEYFSDQDDEDDEDEDVFLKKKKTTTSGYKPGSRQKGNGKNKKEDRKAKGAERAALRHKKEEK